MRVTRLTVEALGQGPSVMRTSRTVLEVLGQVSSVLRASRLDLEVLGEQVAPQLRASRIVAEVLGKSAAWLQTSRLDLEVLGEQAVSWLRTSRVGVEALGVSTTELRVSRLGFEVLGGLVGVCASQLQLTDVAGAVLIATSRESKRMFIFEAPYPGIVTTTILPNLQFSDSEQLLDSVSRKTAVDGTRYTYVKRRSRKKFHWPFRLSRPKSLELFEFYRAYNAVKIRVTDHNGRVWLGYFTTNPLELDVTSKAAPAITPFLRGELVNVDVEFEGTEV